MKSRQKLNIGIWVMVLVTAALLLATGGVLALRLGGYLPSDADVIFLVPRDPSFDANDALQDWSEKSKIDIFSASYSNAKGETVVESATGEGIVAPGVENHYQFYIKNDGNVALDYQILLRPAITVSGLMLPNESFPIEVRIRNQSGDYLVGSEEQWVNLWQMDEVADEGILGKNSYYSYILEWKWLYDAGQDELDTMLGSLSAEEKVEFRLDITSMAQESLDSNATGGLPTGNNTPLPGSLNPIPLIVLICLTLASLILLICLIHLRMKKRKSAVHTGVLLTSMATVGGALSVLFAKIFRNEQDKKGKR